MAEQQFIGLSSKGEQCWCCLKLCWWRLVRMTISEHSNRKSHNYHCEEWEGADTICLRWTLSTRTWEKKIKNKRIGKWQKNGKSQETMNDYWERWEYMYMYVVEKRGVSEGVRVWYVGVWGSAPETCHSPLLPRDNEDWYYNIHYLLLFWPLSIAMNKAGSLSPGRTANLRIGTPKSTDCMCMITP